ncbi:trafficking protein particle complex subunit 11 isoform X2 [Ananas comosus]|nr:trafficking protein particle complex subunit 11 isoform X2 [Ananas comosus]
MIALRKRAEIDAKHLIVFVQNDSSELRQSLNRLASLFSELCMTYYREEGRRIRIRVEKKTFTSTELNIRYCFKVAVYAEFRKDWAEALRYYEDGYRALREMTGTTTRLPPIQRLVEIKAVAEQLHFKISTLLLHGGKVVEAITWFHKHVTSYKQLVGVVEVAFLHWDWFSRQFLVFAELLETSSAAIPATLSHFGTSDNPLTEWEFQPAYYYQLAANYLREKRYSLDNLLSTSDLARKVAGVPESVIPALYLGQSARLFEEGDTVAVLPLSDAEYISYALAEAERYQDAYEIIALFRKAYESFNRRGAPRMACFCSSRMAKEYYAAEDYSNAKQLFESVAGLYRQEGWATVLWESLGYLRECSRKLGSAKEFVGYSLEMAALPILTDEGPEATESRRDYCPAGPATISRRVAIQEEVFALVTNAQTPEAEAGGESNLLLTKDLPLCLNIDLTSPLRIVLLASVAFHDQTVKPNSPTLITVSLLSQLALPVEIDLLEVQFNQPTCNFRIVDSQKDISTAAFILDDQDVRLETALLKLLPNKWLRLTYEIKSGQSGKLECSSIVAKIRKNLMISCQAESPATMEDLPMWKFEDRVESFPIKDRGLSFSGQKVIQVEEPEPQVDLILNSLGPALVGETFIVPVSIHSKGHEVHFGELKINLVDARGGLLMSPREAEPFDSHHVELVSISGTPEEEESQADIDNIRKIQHSFGVVSVPVLREGQSWSCNLEIKWHRPKSVMLYVSLGYSPSSDEATLQRINVHRSLQIEGKIPVIISHRFMAPFRREPLLLSKIKSLTISDQKESLAWNESSTLIVTARNSTEVPLRLTSMSIKLEGESDDKNFCSVHQIGGGISPENALLVPGEDFKGLFSVKPEIDCPKLGLGTVYVSWVRDSKRGENQHTIATRQRLPDINVEKPPLVVSMECPPHAILGIPFSFYVKIRNSTSLLQEIKYSLGDSQNFVLSGPHNHAAFVLPKTEHLISYKLVPLSSGPQQLPRITVASVRYSAALTLSVAAATVFVYPTEPKFGLEGSKSEVVV